MLTAVALTYKSRRSSNISSRMYVRIYCSYSRCAYRTFYRPLSQNTLFQFTFVFDNKRTPWPSVRKRTIPTERPPLVGQILVPTFADRGVSRGQRCGSHTSDVSTASSACLQAQFPDNRRWRAQLSPVRSPQITGKTFGVSFAFPTFRCLFNPSVTFPIIFTVGVGGGVHTSCIPSRDSVHILVSSFRSILVLS
jgi:hypothetical protein